MFRNRIVYDYLPTKDVAEGSTIALDWPSLNYNRGLTNQYVLTGSKTYS